MKIFILFLIYTILFFIFLLSKNLFKGVSPEISWLIIYCFLFWYMLFGIFFYKIDFFRNNYKKAWITTILFILLTWLYTINYLNFDQEINTQEIWNEFPSGSKYYDNFINNSHEKVEKINWLLSQHQRFIWYKYIINEETKSQIYDDLLWIYENWKKLEFPQDDLFFIEDQYLSNNHKNIIHLSHILISSEVKKWNTQISAEILQTNIKIYNYLQQNWIFSGIKYGYLLEIFNENQQYFSPSQKNEIQKLLNQKIDKHIAFRLYILKLIQENKKYLKTQENKTTFFYNNHDSYVYTINYLKNYYTQSNFVLLKEPNLWKYFLNKKVFYEKKIIWDINFWIKNFYK